MKVLSVIKRKSLNHDGEVCKNNKLIEKIEITCPFIGKKDKERAKKLNENGYVINIGHISKELTILKNKIIEKANKKIKN